MAVPCWDGLYTNAQNMFQAMISAEKDSARRERLIDTLLYSYEVRNQAFPEKFTQGYCLGFKAYNLLQYRKDLLKKDINKVEEILDMFIESVEMEKENTQPAIWDKYFQLAEVHYNDALL